MDHTFISELFLSSPSFSVYYDPFLVAAAQQVQQAQAQAHAQAAAANSMQAAQVDPTNYRLQVS